MICRATSRPGADAGVRLRPSPARRGTRRIRVAVAERLPVDVVLAVAVGIDDGDELEVGPLRPGRC